MLEKTARLADHVTQIEGERLQMGFDPQATGSRHRTEQPIAPSFFICIASGCHDFFAAPAKLRAYWPRYFVNRPDRVRIDGFRLYKIDHFWRWTSIWILSLDSRKPDRPFRVAHLSWRPHIIVSAVLREVPRIKKDESASGV
jgi:hypothetical protein